MKFLETYTEYTDHNVVMYVKFYQGVISAIISKIFYAPKGTLGGI